MKKRDINKKPFDEQTLAKLDIFEDYAEAWIPTFVMSNYREIHIFDFFAGSGYDTLGIAGSPIRILKQIERFMDHIIQKGTKVVFHVNEFEKDKFVELESACDRYIEIHPILKRALCIKYYNRDFTDLFEELYPYIQQFPSLVYLDQYGIKYFTEKYIKALETTKTTDFLYFVSSSHFYRFGDTGEFQRYFNFDLDLAKKEPYKFIHRNLIQQMNDLLLQGSELRLYPFSIKKNNNIHGIIFGAKNIRAIDKFLEIGWKRAPVNGDANFDIDDEASLSQLVLFGDQRLSKKEVFAQRLEEYIKTRRIVNNKEVFNFTLSLGHARQHGAEVLKSLKQSKKIDYEGRSPKIEYKYIKNNLDIINISWR